RGGAGQRAGRRRRFLPRPRHSRRSVTDDLTLLTIKEASRLLRLGSISAADLVTAHVERIERLDPHVKAYLRFTPEVWEKQAGEADRKIRSGEAGPLAGIPLAVKDVLCVRGVETTAGSQILRGFKPPYTATAVQRLFDAGAVMRGVTNCDEFAMGRSTENSGYFPTRNPWHLTRVPAGSAGGSAAAVAAGESMTALVADSGVKGMRLGLPREYYEVEGIEPGVKAAIDAALFILQKAGAEIVDVSLPHTDYGLAAYYIIAPAECSSNLARFDGVRYGLSEADAPNITEQYMQVRRKGFGTEVRRRVMLGTYALSTGYY